MRTTLKTALTTTALILALGVPMAAHAQDAAPVQTPAAGTAEFTTEVGQAGKDVVWVPTPQVLVDKMLEMASATVGKGDLGPAPANDMGPVTKGD